MDEVKVEGAVAHCQMATAVQIAARKVVLTEKMESGFEKYNRINSEKEAKKIKAVKRAARKMVKNKQMKKMTAYFYQK